MESVRCSPDGHTKRVRLYFQHHHRDVGRCQRRLSSGRHQLSPQLIHKDSLQRYIKCFEKALPDSVGLLIMIVD